MNNAPARAAIVLIIAIAIAGCVASNETSLPAESAEVRFEIDGQTYAVVGGNGYIVNPDGTLQFVSQLYVPGAARAAFDVTGDDIVRLGDNGARYVVSDLMVMGFEDALDTTDLIGIEHGWVTFTVQSPSAPSVDDYVALKDGILAGRETSRDNRVSPLGTALTAAVPHYEPSP